MNKHNPTIDFLSHRSGSVNKGLTSRMYQRMQQSDVVSREGLANLRVELKVEIDNVAHSLTEMRRWLTKHGCKHQVFHCVRVGSEALIRVEFDRRSESLLDQFCRRFGVGAESAGRPKAFE